MLFFSTYRPGGSHLGTSRRCGAFDYLLPYAKRMLEWDDNGAIQIRDAHGTLWADVSTSGGELKVWLNPDHERQVESEVA